MKKLAILLLLTSFASSSLINSSFAAPKAGASCTKLGTTSNSASKKFTCVKSGKKLMWDKGVVISMAKPAPSPSSSAQLDITYSATAKTMDPKFPKQGDVCKEGSVDVIGYNPLGDFVDLMCNGGKYKARPDSLNPFKVDQQTGKRIESTLYQPKLSYYEKVDINNLKPNLVFGRARQEIADAIKQGSSNSANFNLNFGPSITKDQQSLSRSELDRASKVWEKIFQPKTPIEAIFYDYPDRDWAISLFKKFTGSDNMHGANSCTPTYCGNASNSIVGDRPIVYEQGVGGGNPVNRSTAAHEYTHTAQLSGSKDYWTTAPLWLVEGMADFYGGAIGYSTFDEGNFVRRDSRKTLANDVHFASQAGIGELLAKNDSKIITELMKESEFPTTRYSQNSAALAYLVGGYATEVLVAVYGHDKVQDFVMSFAKSANWQSNFQTTFGISKDDFYIKLTPYMAAMSDEFQ